MHHIQRCEFGGFNFGSGTLFQRKYTSFVVRTPTSLREFQFGSVQSRSHVRLFCEPMDYIAHWAPLSMGLPQAGILEWVAISFSRESSWPRDWTGVSCVGRQILHCWATREATTATYLVLKSITRKEAKLKAFSLALLKVRSFVILICRILKDKGAVILQRINWRLIIVW